MREKSKEGEGGGRDSAVVRRMERGCRDAWDRIVGVEEIVEDVGYTVHGVLFDAVSSFDSFFWKSVRRVVVVPMAVGRGGRGAMNLFGREFRLHLSMFLVR